MSPILWRGKWRTLRKRAAIGRWNTPHHSYTSGSKDVPACVRNIVLTIEILIKFLECRVTADLDQSRYTCARQRPTTFTKFRAPSVNGAEMGGSKVSSTPVFLSATVQRDDFSATSLNFATADFRQIWPRHVNRGCNADFGQKSTKTFHSGVICPQNPKLGGGQTGTPLRAGYRSKEGCTA